jgi:hypothetical protein
MEGEGLKMSKAKLSRGCVIPQVDERFPFWDYVSASTAVQYNHGNSRLRIIALLMQKWCEAVSAKQKSHKLFF